MVSKLQLKLIVIFQSCDFFFVFFPSFLDTSLSNENIIQYRELTPLQLAVLLNKLQNVKSLLDHGANINKSGRGTALIFASTFAVNDEMVELLLKNGANPNIANSDMVYPLHLASSQSNAFKVQLLLDHGAFINVRDKQGKSVLHYAARNEHSSKVLRVLLQNSDMLININAKDLAGNTPLHVAVNCKNFTILSEYGARSDIQNNRGKFPVRTCKCNKACVFYEYNNKLNTLFYFLQKTFVNTKIFITKSQTTENNLFINQDESSDDEGDDETSDNDDSVRSTDSENEGTTDEDSSSDCGESIPKETLGTFFHRRWLFTKNCKNELEILKSTILFDFIFSPLHKLTNLCRNDQVIQIYTACNKNFDNKFKNYGFLLNKKFLQASNRVDLLCRATETFKIMTAEIKVPINCVKMILQHLPNNKLRDLANFY